MLLKQRKYCKRNVLHFFCEGHLCLFRHSSIALIICSKFMEQWKWVVREEWKLRNQSTSPPILKTWACSCTHIVLQFSPYTKKLKQETSTFSWHNKTKPLMAELGLSPLSARQPSTKHATAYRIALKIFIDAVISGLYQLLFYSEF